MRSLRARLLALWLMLLASGTVTGLLLLEFYQQSANARVGIAEEAIARACRDLGAGYRSMMASRTGGPLDEALKQQLSGIAGAALARAGGVEGGFWQADAGSLAYAFPTYEGTGPKTDLPVAELSTIRDVNADAVRAQRPVSVRRVGQSQVLVIHACPLPGPLPEVTGWTMTRAFTATSRAYNQLLIGLAVLALTVVGSAIWLARILYSWSRKIRQLEASLAAHEAGALPTLAPTGERELDRLVGALNAAGARLAKERQRASAAERLAAIGHLAAGLAHEIRNPIAAMRLKAENALAGDDEARRVAALRSILEQIGRLDALLRDLLAMTQRREPRIADVELAAFIDRTMKPLRELAAAKNVKLDVGDVEETGSRPQFDAEQMQRALDNLVLNALQSTSSTVTVEAERRGDHLCLRVRDTGHGIPATIRERLFEPFVTARPDGTGLGLAIVREIARSHGGDARYVPTARGAIFEIEVPWRPF
jgi:signal transduction histidine kinase